MGASRLARERDALLAENNALLTTLHNLDEAMGTLATCQRWTDAPAPQRRFVAEIQRLSRIAISDATRGRAALNAEESHSKEERE